MTILRTEKTWAADANGRYGWCFKDFMSDGSIRWRCSK